MGDEAPPDKHPSWHSIVIAGRPLCDFSKGFGTPEALYLPFIGNMPGLYALDENGYDAGVTWWVCPNSASVWFYEPFADRDEWPPTDTGAHWPNIPKGPILQQHEAVVQEACRVRNYASLMQFVLPHLKHLPAKRIPML